MTDCKTKFYLSFSLLGVFLGYSAGIVFAIFGNDLAVFWSFISATFAMMNVPLHYLHYKDKLEEYYNISVLQNIHCFAFVSTTIFTAVFLWYIFQIFYYNLPILPIKDSYAIVAVWCFMTTKWSTMLVNSTDRYIKILCNSGRPLLQS